MFHAQVHGVAPTKLAHLHQAAIAAALGYAVQKVFGRNCPASRRRLPEAPGGVHAHLHGQMLSSRACRLWGSTMPVVPRIERPPTMPRLGLKVLLPPAPAPLGQHRPGSGRPPCVVRLAPVTSCSCWAIIRRGTGVDGRRAHRLVQAGLCHPAHPFAAVHPDRPPGPCTARPPLPGAGGSRQSRRPPSFSTAQ